MNNINFTEQNEDEMMEEKIKIEVWKAVCSSYLCRWL